MTRAETFETLDGTMVRVHFPNARLVDSLRDIRNTMNSEEVDMRLEVGGRGAYNQPMEIETPVRGTTTADSLDQCGAFVRQYGASQGDISAEAHFRPNRRSRLVYEPIFSAPARRFDGHNVDLLQLLHRIEGTLSCSVKG